MTASGDRYSVFDEAGERVLAGVSRAEAFAAWLEAGRSGRVTRDEVAVKARTSKPRHKTTPETETRP